MIVHLYRRLEYFFFQPVSASGFGLMRIAWASGTLLFMLFRFSDVIFLYSDNGLIPPELYQHVFRSTARFSLLDYFSSTPAVWMLYAFFCVTLALCALGIWTRVTMLTALLLMFSFHERNLFPLGGGDTLLRNMGFILFFSPGLHAFSLTRLRAQWQRWRTTKELLPALTMPIWPYRLVLWQFLMIYITSAIDKTNGSMWLDGTAVISSVHHEHFARFPLWMMDLLAPLSQPIAYAVLLFEFSWLMLFLPNGCVCLLTLGLFDYHRFKRGLLLGGIAFHGGIFALMSVGTFPAAITCGYLGLLFDPDFAAMKSFCNGRRWQKKRITVLYDENCRLCRRSVFGLQLLDWLGRLSYVNYHDEHKRKAVDPTLSFAELDKAMHIKLPDGNTRKGFLAIRKLCFHLPLLWPLTLLLHLPGMSHIGAYAYGVIAHRRKQCTDEFCTL